MSSVTTNYGLYKANPVTDGADNFNIDTLLNENLDKIDVALGNKAETDHTHNAATTTVPGIMSAADKLKMDGIAAGATSYVHPARHAASMITQSSAYRIVNDAQKANWNAKVSSVSPSLSGVQTAPTAAASVKNSQIATTAFARSVGLLYVTGSFTMSPRKEKTINLGFKPILVFIYKDGNNDSYYPLGSGDPNASHVVKSYTEAYNGDTGIVANGFTAETGSSAYTDPNYYIAFYR